MNWSSIKKLDIANGLGVRVSLFVSGCRNHCKGCFNPETWDFEAGRTFEERTEDEIINLLKPVFVRGLSILGGEPLEPENQASLVQLLRRVRLELPDKDVWCFTGFTFEELAEGCRATTPLLADMLALVDVLVDGPFVLEKKDIRLRFRGSSNQRLLDLPRSLEEGKPVLWTES